MSLMAKSPWIEMIPEADLEMRNLGKHKPGHGGVGKQDRDKAADTRSANGQVTPVGTWDAKQEDRGTRELGCLGPSPIRPIEAQGWSGHTVGLGNLGEAGAGR